MERPEIELLNISQAAEYIGVSRRTLYVRSGSFAELPFYKVGSLVKFDKRDLDAFIQKCFVPGRAPAKTRALEAHVRRTTA